MLRECPSAAACSAQKGYSEANAHNSRRSQLDTIYSAASAKLRVLQYLTCNDHRLAAIVHELALAVSRICVIRTALRIRLASHAMNEPSHIPRRNECADAPHKQRQINSGKARPL